MNVGIMRAMIPLFDYFRSCLLPCCRLCVISTRWLYFGQNCRHAVTRYIRSIFGYRPSYSPFSGLAHQNEDPIKSVGEVLAGQKVDKSLDLGSAVLAASCLPSRNLQGTVWSLCTAIDATIT